VGALANLEHQRQQAGVIAPAAPNGLSGVAPIPQYVVSERAVRVRTSKDERRQFFQTSLNSLLAEAGQSVANLGPGADAGVMARVGEERRQLDAFPEGEFDLDVTAHHAGMQSIDWSNAWNSTQELDPVRVIFHGNGSGSYVNWLLQNSTRRLWSFTNCGTTQWVYTWDAQHGGTDGWGQMISQLEWDNGLCGTARYHVRLFDRGYYDSHGSYGWWSTSSPHHDNAGHTCADEWENSQWYLADSFYDGCCGPLPFVIAITRINIAAPKSFAGGCGGLVEDGWGWFVWLR